MTGRFLLVVLLVGLSSCATTALPVQESVLREVRLNETARLGALQVTPIAIAEESRCPLGVQCIQAGTVRIEASVVSPGSNRRSVLALGIPERIDGGWVSLVRACPLPVHGSRVRPRDYRFSLLLTTKEMPTLIDAPGCGRR